jgi:16S rRNA (cytidine1402-2'-O)-methyltransferase
MDEQKKPKGILYIVATPIGNLEDITFRAVKVLQEVDLIAAEDTRHTKKLLNTYGVATPLTSLFDRNERGKSGYIISRLSVGQNIAYVSDAGTPGVSDPGFVLINAAIDAGIKVVPIPGVSAVVTALSAAGLPMDSFVFYAFVPHSEGKRRSFFSSLLNETRTMIFYDSPKRVLATLKIIREIFGQMRRIVLARELTKIHEEIIRGSIEEVIQALGNREIKGEITVLLAGAEEVRNLSLGDIKDRYIDLRRNPSLTTKDIIERIAEETGLPRKDVYKYVLELKET